jgi:hypothetical protein
VISSLAHGSSAYRLEHGRALIEIRLHESRQLFHTLDPSPFREKDLEPAAEAYIVEAVREIGLRRLGKLIVYLPSAECSTEVARTLPDAIVNYFEYRLRQSRIELRRLLGRGAASLAIGLVFMFACLALRRWLTVEGAPEVLSEGLLIIGWVALWRPLEIFLYDWWPLHGEGQIFRAIASMPIEVRPVP